MKKYCLDLTVSSVEHLNEKYALLKLTSDDCMPEMCPGQFVEVRVDNSPSTMLRRPISIHYFNAEKNEIWFLVAAVGEGTRHLCGLKAGDIVNCVFPLGNGFSLPVESNDEMGMSVAERTLSVSDKFLLVGGGVGVAPLYYLGSEIKRMGGNPTFLIGARTAADLLEIELYKQVGTVYITTEDGSEGEKGFVTNHSILQKEHFDMISVCGPLPMMKAVASYARKAGSVCEVSLENHMACGVGACLCCVEKTTAGNVCVCKEGPVFNINKLLWQD